MPVQVYFCGAVASAGAAEATMIAGTAAITSNRVALALKLNSFHPLQLYRTPTKNMYTQRLPGRFKALRGNTVREPKGPSAPFRAEVPRTSYG